MLVPATGVWTGGDDWYETQTSFDPLFKDVHSTCQGVATARSTLDEIYDKSGQIAQAIGMTKEVSNTEILRMLVTRRADLSVEQLSYFADALLSARTAKSQAQTSVEACKNLQTKLEKAIEEAPVELALQPWKIKKVVKGLKNSVTQINDASQEGVTLVKELTEVILLLQKITLQETVK
jgi:seryl-tRNA synthetase